MFILLHPHFLIIRYLKNIKNRIDFEIQAQKTRQFFRKYTMNKTVFVTLFDILFKHQTHLNNNYIFIVINLEQNLFYHVIKYHVKLISFR